jgi:hypothetical protein
MTGADVIAVISTGICQRLLRGRQPRVLCAAEPARGRTRHISELDREPRYFPAGVLNIKPHRPAARLLHYVDSESVPCDSSE